MARKHEMDLVWEAEDAARAEKKEEVTTVPWPKPKDRGGVSFVTVKGVRYQVAGTGHSWNVLMKKVKDGEATVVESDNA